jgi:cold shock CspA family protein
MSDKTGTDELDRKTGKVVRLLEEFGFISCDDLPGQDVYFKTSWFRGSPPLREGDAVTFSVKAFGERRQAATW